MTLARLLGSFGNRRHGDKILEKSVKDTQRDCGVQESENFFLSVGEVWLGGLALCRANKSKSSPRRDRQQGKYRPLAVNRFFELFRRYDGATG